MTSMNLDEIIGKIDKIIEMLESAEYVGGIGRGLVSSEKFVGRDDFMFIAGVHIGMITGLNPTRDVESAIEDIVIAHEEAVKMLPNITDSIDLDTLESFNKALGKRIGEKIADKECDCPKCRAKREAEGE